ncbi:hypothetical protein EGY16_05075 [Burkholderia pseudomallei]|nr:hypothetical protein BOC42_00150 [Burkholderia pseudomallei]EDO84315.1 lauroyl/myristoyl acyltransferase [Burkholderia pseudomallei 406e]EDS87142.1 hypothetical protein BURPSS13_P0076 [Burkholderia pseudomallei S13]EEC33358.1 conserved hypothetical protein [Burkholderia pseudomallei 576]EXJ02287.1 hypothetical protein T210_0110435 [Burkholderia pseudomallei MSHR6137]KGX66590.1 hypothetical protein Y026_5708 [Burkholderia pseudomallei TSV28]PNX02828.1 hypothetical protein CF649_15480 [Burkh
MGRRRRAAFAMPVRAALSLRPRRAFVAPPLFSALLLRWLLRWLLPSPSPLSPPFPLPRR